MHNFKELNVWKKSKDLVSEIYAVTEMFDNSEKYALTRQIRRAAISVPSNIAEGCGRGTDKQLSYFLDVAIGSICELETQLLIAIDLNYIEKDKINLLINKIEEIRKMIHGFKMSLNI